MGKLRRVLFGMERSPSRRTPESLPGHDRSGVGGEIPRRREEVFSSDAFGKARGKPPLFCAFSPHPSTGARPSVEPFRHAAAQNPGRLVFHRGLWTREALENPGREGKLCCLTIWGAKFEVS